MSVSNPPSVTRWAPGALVECGNGDTGLLISGTHTVIHDLPHVSEQRPLPYRQFYGRLIIVGKGNVWVVLVDGTLCWEHEENLVKIS